MRVPGSYTQYVLDLFPLHNVTFLTHIGAENKKELGT